MAICKALILVSLFVSTVSANVDIDYSHNVAGNGTVITDYRMGDQETSVASGAIRGTGNVFNSYSFSTNNSSILRVEDRFVLTTNEKATTMSVAPSFPPWPEKPGRFKLIGKSWAENIEIGSLNSSHNYNSSHASSLEASGSKERKSNNDGGAAEFKFSGASQEGTAALAATRISGTRNLNFDASLDIGQAKDAEGFDYSTIWSNSGNVSVRSVIGQPRAVLYEEDGRASGNSTGLKRLNIFSS